MPKASSSSLSKVKLVSMEKLTLTTPPLEEAVASSPPAGRVASPKLRSGKLKAGLPKGPLSKLCKLSRESSPLKLCKLSSQGSSLKL